MKKSEDNLPASRLNKEQAERFWKAYVQKSINFENRFGSNVSKIFTRQEQETITKLNKTQKALNQGDIEDVLFTLSEENKSSAEILVPILRDYFEKAGEDAIDLTGSDETFNMSDAAVRQFFRTRALQGIKKMNRVTRHALRFILSDAIREGSSIEQVTRNIRDLFEDARKVRAERIARTEIMRAGNSATLEGYKQSGVVAGKQWFTALDESTCQWCQPMHGRIKALDNNYFAKGESWTGNRGGQIKLEFEDIGSPPLHPNCRCVLIPIVLGARAAKPTKKEQKVDLEVEKDVMREELKKELIPQITEQVKKNIDEEIGKVLDEI